MPDCTVSEHASQGVVSLMEFYLNTHTHGLQRSQDDMAAVVHCACSDTRVARCTHHVSCHSLFFGILKLLRAMGKVLCNWCAPGGAVM
eukprot:6198404-Amphidinium_carterae.1